MLKHKLLYYYIIQSAKYFTVAFTQHCNIWESSTVQYMNILESSPLAVIMHTQYKHWALPWIQYDATGVFLPLYLITSPCVFSPGPRHTAPRRHPQHSGRLFTSMWSKSRLLWPPRPTYSTLLLHSLLLPRTMLYPTPDTNLHSSLMNWAVYWCPCQKYTTI